MQEMNPTDKYLGLPSLSIGQINTKALEFVKEKIMLKTHSWKQALLYHAGKEVMIKSVLHAIPMHSVMILHYPKGFLCSSQ